MIQALLHYLRQNSFIIGIFFMLGFCAIAPIMDVGLKSLNGSMPVTQIIWLRFVSHIMLMLPIVLIVNPRGFLRPARLSNQLIRSSFLAIATICYVIAIQTMQIPDAVTLVFIAPMIATMLSSIVLKEHVGIRRWSAVIVGFIGVIIVLNPQATIIDTAAFFALGCGVAYGMLMVITKHMSIKDSPLVTVSYTPIMGFIILGFILYWQDNFVMPQGTTWWIIVIIGLTGAASQYCFIRAFKYGNASLLGVFMYFEIISATIISWFVFDYFPNLQTWAGIIVLSLAGVYISWRETVKKRPI